MKRFNSVMVFSSLLIALLLVLSSCSQEPNVIAGGQGSVPSGAPSAGSGSGGGAAPVIQNVTTSTPQPVANETSSTGSTVNSSPANTSLNASTTTTTSNETTLAAPRVIIVTASNWKFEPSTITIKKNENVTLRVTSIDVTHGLSIPALGIAKTLSSNETVDISLSHNQSGSFPFRCSVMCGEGHMSMTGSIVVEE